MLVISFSNANAAYILKELNKIDVKYKSTDVITQKLLEV